jgi:ankyrin repeat protein
MHRPTSILPRRKAGHRSSLLQKKGHSAIVAQLIAARSNNDLPTTTSGATPIFAAAENGHVHVVAQLIAGRCNVNLARTTDGATPFLRASEKRHCCGDPWHAHDRAL